MIEFSISNPHDSYTLRAPDFVTALAAIALVGEGRYGIEGGGFKAPPVPFGPDWPAEVYQSAGITGILDLMHQKTGRLQTDAAFNEAVAVACESIKRKGRLTSTVDLESIGKGTAEALRGQRTFASVT